MKLSAPGEIVAPVAAATILLLRDSASGIEVFMQKRHSAMDFGDAYVFPGGKTCDSDHDALPAANLDDFDDQRASELLGVPSGGLSFYLAAIRECFEESGYLLAKTFDGCYVDPCASDARRVRFLSTRAALSEGKGSLQEFCVAENLRLACNDIHYVSFWTTPEVMSRRYATRFFWAAAPAAQEGIHDGKESMDSCWVSVKEALTPENRKAMRLHLPTVENLKSVAEHGTTRAALSAVRALDTSRIKNILPIVRVDEDKVQIEIDGQKQMPETGP